MLEALSLLELALWEAKIDAVQAMKYDTCEGAAQKKIKIDESSTSAPVPIPLDSVDREKCRINCGADIVIPNVLSFLDPPTATM